MLCTYRKVASSILSRSEAHAGLFRLSMKGIFDPYLLRPFDKTFIFELATRVITRNSMVNHSECQSKNKNDLCTQHVLSLYFSYTELVNQ